MTLTVDVHSHRSRLPEYFVTGVTGLPRIRPGDDLASLLSAAIELRAGDVLVVAQKLISKAEGREVDLSAVVPSPEAVEIASDDGDARVIELILREATSIVRRRGSFLVAETRHGFICAAAGVDRSNTSAPDHVILLPLDPDASANALRDALGCDVAVVISDSFGRPFRLGTTGVALGCAGLEPLVAHTGESDDSGRVLQGTEINIADQLASAAELVMGAFGGVPAARIRGYAWRPGTRGARALVLPVERDLFR